jgi:hypothetical protein
MNRELLQQCLDVLKSAVSSHGRILTSNPPQDAWTFNNVDQRCNDAIQAIEQELAEPRNEFNPDWDQQAVLVEHIRELEKELAKHEQEPTRKACDIIAEKQASVMRDRYFDIEKFYAEPPRKEWVGLTDEEISCIAYNECEKSFVRLVEAKLKEKNA